MDNTPLEGGKSYSRRKGHRKHIRFFLIFKKGDKFTIDDTLYEVIEENGDKLKLLLTDTKDGSSMVRELPLSNVQKLYYEYKLKSRTYWSYWWKNF